MTAIPTGFGPQGEILHVVPHPAPALPAVTRRDLERAFEYARESALSCGPASAEPAARMIRFLRPDLPPVDLRLVDRDAAGWASAVDRLADLSTAHGISVCLRLLALIDLLGRSHWTRSWFTLGRAGLDLHPALLQAAALSPLTETAGFAETALQDLLPAGANGWDQP